MESELDFPLLDDILHAASTGDTGIAEEIRAAEARSIGPVVEYACHAPQSRGLPSIAELRDGPLVREFRRVATLRRFDRMPASAAHEAEEVEFHWAPPTLGDFDAQTWIMFLRRMQDAASRAGFRHRLPAGMIGAFLEMADNALHHSLRPLTALCGYRWGDRCFEYVVADAGQGMLAGLRSCDEYAHLRDEGDALQTALTEGESRLGRGSGHGLGFRQLFLSLADLNGRLRFRSGDHALTIDGTNPDLSRARLSQLGATCPGFLVSVTCSPS